MRSWVIATRPKTLVAALVPVMVGASLAKEHNLFSATPVLLCLIFALVIQIASNFANDYYDFLKGADGSQRLGPKRVVAAGLITPAKMRLAMILTLCIAFFVGLALLPYGGMILLWIGVASLVCAVAYTGGPFPLAYLGLGDIFVIAFFGIIAVAFTFYVQTGNFVADVWWAGLAVGLIINNLLVVNNYRDIEEDRLSNKKTLAVRFGPSFSLIQLRLQTFGAIFCAYWISAVDKWLYLLPTLSILIFGFTIVRKIQKAKSPTQFEECLRLSALMVPLFGILLCFAILI